MRPVATILFHLAVVGTLLIAPIAVALGQERSDRAEAGIEWSRLANGRTDFEVSDPALLPTRLALAAERSGCRYKEAIGNSSPARFTKIGSYRLAILACWSISGWHQVFDLSTLERPRPVEFPVAVRPEGFGTTLRPGWINWEKETSIFQAVRGSDMVPSWKTRHTHRFDGHSGFVVVRVEIQRVPWPDEWTSIWQTPRWPLPEGKQ